MFKEHYKCQVIIIIITQAYLCACAHACMVTISVSPPKGASKTPPVKAQARR